MPRIRLLVMALLVAAIMSSCSGKKPAVTVEQVTNPSYVTGIAVDGNTAYCATLGGLVTWDLKARKYTLATTADGLPGNVLSDVVIDGDGKLWISSDEGVAVRKGSGWKLFTAANSLPSNIVRDLSLDRKGNVWAATDHGVVFFKNGRPHLLDEKDGPGQSSVNRVYVDAGNNLWVGTEKGIFAKIEGVWKKFPAGVGNIAEGEKAISQTWNARILAGSPGGFSLFLGEKFIASPETKRTGTFIISDIISTKQHNWLFTANGVYAVRGEEWMSFTEHEGLISNMVTCGFVVSDDRVFAGTPDGMSLIEKGVVTNYSIPNTPHGSDFVSLCGDATNRLFAGASDGGLNLLDSGYWAAVAGKDLATFSKIRSITLSPEKNPVFNTDKGVVTLQDHVWRTETRNDGIIGDDVRCGVYDREGRYWVGTSVGVSCLSGNVWTRYRASHGLPSEDIRTCMLDSSGTVWFGTAAGMVSFSKNTLTNWTKEAGKDSIEVTAVAASRDKIYFGTAEGRLIVYDGKKWTHSKPVSAPIMAILPDASGVIWVASDGDGLIRTGKGGDVRYSIAEGMPSNRVHALAIHDGRLVAACHGGLGFIPLSPVKK